MRFFSQVATLAVAAVRSPGRMTTRAGPQSADPQGYGPTDDPQSRKGHFAYGKSGLRTTHVLQNFLPTQNVHSLVSFAKTKRWA